LIPFSKKNNVSFFKKKQKQKFIPRFLEGIPELEQNQKQILLSGLKHNEVYIYLFTF